MATLCLGGHKVTTSIAGIARGLASTVAACPGRAHVPVFALVSHNLAGSAGKRTRDIGRSSRRGYPPRLPKSEAVSLDARALTPSWIAL
jgi:hypothetical protein